MSKILLGGNVWLDLPILITTRLLITASSGGGKSETLRRLLEESVGHVQCIVIDPEGEFSTLRAKHPFVLVGEGGETPADIRTAELVATRLLELNASAICDIYEMKVHERHEWVRRFLGALVSAPKELWHPVVVVLDEAHTYAPEKGYGESVASQAVIDLANLGRKRGFCLVAATQRLSKLSKNVVEPLQNILIGRTMYDDQERAARVFKVKPGADTRNFSLELEALNAGEFIARGRAFSMDNTKFQVTRGQTRPPVTGKAMAGVATPTPDAVRALLPRLADLPREAEKKTQTEADLRETILQLRRQIADSQHRDNSQTVFETARTEHVRALDERILGLEKIAERSEKENRRFVSTLHEWRTFYDQLSALIASMEPEEIAEPGPVQDLPPAPPVYVEDMKFHHTSAPPRVAASNHGGKLTGTALRIAQVAAAHRSAGVRRDLLASLLGKTDGGSFSARLSEAKSAGAIELDGATVRATPWAQKEFAGAFMLPTNTREALAVWGHKLKPGSIHARIVDYLISNKGREVARETLAQAVGSTDGGSFSARLSEVRSTGLMVDTRKGYVAADKEKLFL